MCWSKLVSNRLTVQVNFFLFFKKQDANTIASNERDKLFWCFTIIKSHIFGYEKVEKNKHRERKREITWIFTCLNFRRKNGSFVKLTKENVIGTSIFSIFKSRKNTCNSISRTLFRFPFATANIFRWVFFFIRIYFDETWFNDRKKKKQKRMNLKRLYSKEFRYFEIESNENSNGKIWFASWGIRIFDQNEWQTPFRYM